MKRRRRRGRDGSDLDEHLGATIALGGGAVHGHGLPVTGELQGEVLLHQLLDDLQTHTQAQRQRS